MWTVLRLLLPLLISVALVLTFKGDVVEEEDFIPTEGFGEPYDSQDGCQAYDGYFLFEARKQEEYKNLVLLHMMQDNVTDSVSKIIFMDAVVTARHPVRFAVSPDTLDDVVFTLRRQKIPFWALTENIAERLDKWEFNKNLVAKQQFDDKGENHVKSKGINYFMPYEVMSEYLKNISSENENAKLMNIGKSYEGRDMLGIAINDDRKDLPGIWVDAGIDPRKWMSHATALYLITYILRYEYAADAKVMRENFRWYIVPNINPDGYVHTWLKDRFWRKTRSKQRNGCFGADMNRNWDTITWLDEMDTCSPYFGGDEPMSEIETRNVRDAIMSRKDQLDMYIGLQSYGQNIIVPGYQNSYDFNYDYEAQWTLAKSGMDAIKNHNKQREYSFGNAISVKHATNGNMIDWVHQNTSVDRETQELNTAEPSERPMIRFTYAFDLPPSPTDMDNYMQMADPPSDIYVTAAEVTSAMAAMCRHLLKGVHVDVESLYGDDERQLPPRFNDEL